MPQNKPAQTALRVRLSREQELRDLFMSFTEQDAEHLVDLFDVSTGFEAIKHIAMRLPDLLAPEATFTRILHGYQYSSDMGDALQEVYTLLELHRYFNAKMALSDGFDLCLHAPCAFGTAIVELADELKAELEATTVDAANEQQTYGKTVISSTRSSDTPAVVIGVDECDGSDNTGKYQVEAKPALSEPAASSSLVDPLSVSPEPQTGPNAQTDPAAPEAAAAQIPLPPPRIGIMAR